MVVSTAQDCRNMQICRKNLVDEIVSPDIFQQIEFIAQCDRLMRRQRPALAVDQTAPCTAGQAVAGLLTCPLPLPPSPSPD
jgi:hypothetical protein